MNTKTPWQSKLFCPAGDGEICETRASTYGPTLEEIIHPSGHDERGDARHLRSTVMEAMDCAFLDIDISARADCLYLLAEAELQFAFQNKERLFQFIVEMWGGPPSGAMVTSISA